MPKKELNSTIDGIVKQSGKTSLGKLAKEVTFNPSARQSKIKASFWSRHPRGLAAEDMTVANVMAIVKDPGMQDWWGKPGFQDWFFNQEEGKEKLNYLFIKAIDTCENILDDERANANAKVKVLELVAKLLDKFPNPHKHQFADDDVNKMSEAELEKFLEKAALDYLSSKKGIVIKQERVIDVKQEEDDS